MPTLTPNVENVAGLVLDMMDGTWPTSDDDRQVFYSSHGLTQVASSAGEALRREHGRTLMHQFETSLPGVYGIDTMFRDEFLGLSLFAYDESVDDGAASRAAYPLLRDLLSDRLGAPAEEWGTAHEPACYWRCGPCRRRCIASSGCPAV